MAKITPVILDEDANADGTWNVKIRLAHKSKSLYIGTDEFVGKKNLTPAGDIKPSFIVSNLTEILTQYNKILKDNKHLLPDLTHHQVKELLEGEGDTTIQRDVMMLEFCKEHNETITVANTKLSYVGAYNRLNDYLDGVDIPVKQITSSFLKGYEQYLRQAQTVIRIKDGVSKKMHFKAGGNTSVNTNMVLLRSFINFAKEKYNNEETESILIPNSPFSFYKIIPPDEVEPRDYSISQVARIRDIRLKSGSRAELARDLAMLSFYLCGMNLADMYRLSEGLVNRVEYNRKKTEFRRTDNAFISIKLIEEAKDLYIRYAGKLQVMYPKYSSLNDALLYGFKRLRLLLGEEYKDLDYYSLRHAIATIAHNDCGYSIEQVGLILNHSSNSKHKITSRYIRKSWNIIDEIQRSVVSLLPGQVIDLTV